MRVLVVERTSLVADTDFSLSVSARLTEALDYLRDQGVLDYVVVPEHAPEALRALPHVDAVFFNKHASHHALAVAQAARRRGLRVIADLDDWIFDFPSYSGGSPDRVATAEGAKKVIAQADTVTVANAHLLASIRQYHPNPVLIPNGIYVEKYAPPSWHDEERPLIAFANADFLKVKAFKDDFIRALQDFWRAHPHYAIDFFGDGFPEIVMLPFVHFTPRIPYEAFMHCLVAGRYEFAITPLGGAEDEEELFFNRCKNPFKFLNYGAARIPAIYSRTPIYEECIVHGRTGLIVENTYESWLASMTRMASDAELRRYIRQSAFEEICEKFHIRHSAVALLQVLTSGPAALVCPHDERMVGQSSSVLHG